MDALENNVLAACKARGLHIATAESCTGGLIAERITAIPGSSSVFLGSVVSYANSVKRDVLGVPQQILDYAGAVSHECAKAMAAGARRLLRTDIAVAVTGIAGPDGGTPQKPVGLVYLAVATAKTLKAERHLYKGDRASIRRQASDRALELFLEAVQE